MPVVIFFFFIFLMVLGILFGLLKAIITPIVSKLFYLFFLLVFTIISITKYSTIWLINWIKKQANNTFEEVKQHNKEKSRNSLY